MTDLFWLSGAQLKRIKPYFPLSHGMPRADDLQVVSGIVFVIKNGLRWRDAPKEYCPHKTLYNRFIRWSRMGVFDRISQALPGKRDAGSAHHRFRPSQAHSGEPSKKRAVPRCLGRTKGGLNSKLHAVTDQDGKPLILLLTPGQMSDHKGAKLMLPQLPPAKSLTGEKGYDSDAFRKALIERGIDLASRPRKTASARSPTMRRSTKSGTKSKTASPGSKTGGGSQRATTAARTPSSQHLHRRQLHLLSALI